MLGCSLRQIRLRFVQFDSIGNILFKKYQNIFGDTIKDVYLQNQTMSHLHGLSTEGKMIHVVSYRWAGPNYLCNPIIVEHH